MNESSKAEEATKPGAANEELERKSTADVGTRSAGNTKPEQRAKVLAALRLSTSFMRIVTVLMRSAHYRHYTLGDLEWLVVPPLMAGQFSIAQNKASGSAAVALWASVSADVDHKLSKRLQRPIRLKPEEWRSGDIFWIIDVVGDPQVLPNLRQKLIETVFKGREVKMRVRDDSGNVSVQRISAVRP